MKIIQHDNYLDVDGLKCHWNFWLLPKSFIAITLFGHIFFNISKDELLNYLQTWDGQRTINHERIHVVQANSFKTKYLGFYLLYISFWIKNLFVHGPNIQAYYHIPFEIEAFNNDFMEYYPETKW